MTLEELKAAKQTITDECEKLKDKLEELGSRYGILTNDYIESRIGFRLQRMQTLLAIDTDTDRTCILIVGNFSESFHGYRVDAEIGYGSYMSERMNLGYSTTHIKKLLEPSETLNNFLKENLTYTHDNKSKLISEYRRFIIKKHKL